MCNFSGGLGLKLIDDCIIGIEIAYGCTGIGTAIAANGLAVSSLLYRFQWSWIWYILVHYITLHYITSQYSTVQYSTVQYSTVTDLHYSCRLTVQCSMVWYSMVCITLYMQIHVYVHVVGTALYYIVLYYSVLFKYSTSTE